MLDRTTAALIATLLTFKDRLDGVREDEAGFTTLEWVVIGLGVFLAATLAVGVIAAAISGRLAQIN
jgi:hypothetical protein